MTWCRSRIDVYLRLILLCASAELCRAGDALWDSQPYRVEIAVDLAKSGLSAPQRKALIGRSRELLRARLGAFWALDFAAADSEAPAEAAEKRFQIRIVEQLGKTDVLIQEYDSTVDHTGREVARTIANTSELPEVLYEGILESFRPLARFQRDPETPEEVVLQYRAIELAPSEELATVSQSDLLLPYRRQLDRHGDPVPGGVKRIAWSYLVAQPNAEGVLRARALSHSRRAVVGRPSRKLESLALAIGPTAVTPTQLKLHAIGKPTAPLAGYEVFLGGKDRQGIQSIGRTDAEGAIELPAQQGPYFAHVRAGSNFVASLPIASGVDAVVVVPLADERARLRAEEEVAALSEGLVDTVARRKILARRIELAIEQQNISQARLMLDELDKLPSRTHYTRELERTERSTRVDHPAAQKRLDSLFAKTRQLLNAALDPRELRKISQSVEAARRAQANPTSSTEQRTEES